MAIVWSLVAALAFGVSDFAAGMAARRDRVGRVTVIVQAMSVGVAAVAVAVFPGEGPTRDVLGWGAVSGIGNAAGTLLLYRGLVVGTMSVVAPVSAVLVAVIPVLVGFAGGAKVSMVATAGIVVALPAIGLVSWAPTRRGNEADPPARYAGVGYAVGAGVGLAMLFVALDRAGTAGGAWPLLSGAVVSLAVVAPFVHLGAGPADVGGPHSTRPRLRGWPVAMAAGALGGAGTLSFLAATGAGTLPIVAVVTALYPAATVVLARVWLAEAWSTRQVLGLVAAAAAIILVSIA